MAYIAYGDKITVTLTNKEAGHLLYGLESVWIGSADKETMLPEDYRDSLRLQRSIVAKFKKAGIEKKVSIPSGQVRGDGVSASQEKV